MKHVLYVGPYRQTDAWGQTSRAFLEVLRTIPDINLAARPVWFTNMNQHLDLPYQKYEQNKLEEYDVIIQYGLPSYLNYSGIFAKNIAVTSLDCEIKNSNWADHLNLFDQILVFSKNEADLLSKSGVNTLITHTNFPPVLYDNTIEDLNLNFSQIKIYANVGDEKSGLKELLISYLTEFVGYENVILLLPTSNPQALEQDINNVKKMINPNENAHIMFPHIGIIGKESPGIMNYLHRYGDIFIDISYESRVNYNIINAIENHSVPVLLDTCKNISKYHDLFVESYSEPIIYHNKPVPDIYTIDNNWKKPQIQSIKQNLRKAVDNLDTYKTNKITLDYTHIYETISQALCLD